MPIAVRLTIIAKCSHIEKQYCVHIFRATLCFFPSGIILTYIYCYTSNIR